MKTRILTLSVVAASLFAFSLFPAAAQEDECYAKNGTWDADTSQCKLTVGVTVDVDYPLEYAAFPEAAAVIDSFIANQQQAFIASYTPDYSLPSYANNWWMGISHEDYQFSDSIRSIVFTNSFYTGGAHPNSGYSTFTFDVANGTQLQLEDLFVDGTIPWDSISALVQDDLNTRLTDMTDAATIELGTGMNPDNYKSWALTPDSLIFFFDPYQVAAYAAGPQQSEIPLSTFAGQLNSPFAS